MKKFIFAFFFYCLASIQTIALFAQSNSEPQSVRKLKEFGEIFGIYILIGIGFLVLLLMYANKNNPKLTSTSGKRIAAGFIDLMVVQLIIYLAKSVFSTELPVIVNILISCSYFFTRDNFLNGGIGKKLLNLKIIKQDGGSLVGDWKAAILHNLVLAIIPIIEGIAIIATGQSIGERIAGTSVTESANSNVQSTTKNISTTDVYVRLEKLGELKEKGILSAEEFEKEKAEILKKS